MTPIEQAYQDYREELLAFLNSHGVPWGYQHIVKLEEIVRKNPARQAEVKDSIRLDWLEQQSDGSYWVARQSSAGRGYRLHNIGHSNGAKDWLQPVTTAREAIDRAMQLQSLFPT